MKKLVFVLLLFVNLSQAQKIEIGFMLVPQITSSNFKAPEKIAPLHSGIWYNFKDNKTFTAIAYTVENKNLFFAIGYENYYVVKSFNLNNNGNYVGFGTTFPISRFNPSVLFVELGTSYYFKEKNNFPLILSTGIFVPFRKLIYEKKQGSS
jgi:hypothetical protein